ELGGIDDRQRQGHLLPDGLRQYVLTHKARAQDGMSRQELAPAADKGLQVEGSLQMQGYLLSVEPTLERCLAMEEQPGLHARQRIEILQSWAAALCKPRRTVGYLSQQAIQTFLRELQQGEVLWNIGAVIRLEGLSNQLLQAR